MATQSPETDVPKAPDADAVVRQSSSKSPRAPRAPLSQVVRELKWPLLLAVGIGSGVLWVVLLLQSGYLQFFAGLLPVTGGILVGRQAKRHVNWHAAALSAITAITAALVATIATNLIPTIPPELKSALATGFIVLVPFPAFGVITSARSEGRAREAREIRAKRGGKLDRPGRVKTLDDLRALSLNQLGGYVADLFRRHGFLVDDYEFGKENTIDFNLRKDDVAWLVRVTVEEKVKQGAVLQLLQQLRSQRGTKGVLITSMDFQDQAVRAAKDKLLALIDGPTLLSMDD